MPASKAPAAHSFPAGKLRWKSLLPQVLFLAVLAFLLTEAFLYGRANMRAHHIPTDFGFLFHTSGFDINQRLLPYSAAATYLQAFYVGLLNTLLVAALGLILASVIGVAVGLARLSQNLAVSKLALAYVEAVRNVPLLLQLLFWYNAVLRPLPLPEDSFSFFGVVFLNNRGFVLPEVEGIGFIALAFCAGAAGAVLAWRMTNAGWPVMQRIPLCSVILLLPLIVLAVFAPQSFSVSTPVLGPFNYEDCWRIRPEFIALLIGLSIYTASFIAEIVRAGILSVPRGLTEAAQALGMQQGQTMRLIVLPLSLRVIIPPLTSQYVNLVKNSSLAVFIGYPDLVQIFAGTVLNQTGAAVQVMGITMTVYLALSLLISAAMNALNRRYLVPERKA